MAVFLDVRRVIELSRQRTHLPDLYFDGARTRRRENGKSQCSASLRSRQLTSESGFRGIRVHGSQQLYRQWSQFYGEEHRRASPNQHAILWSLHAVFSGDVDSDLCLNYRCLLSVVPWESIQCAENRHIVDTNCSVRLTDCRFDYAEPFHQA